MPLLALALLLAAAPASPGDANAASAARALDAEGLVEPGTSAATPAPGATRRAALDGPLAPGRPLRGPGGPDPGLFSVRELGAAAGGVLVTDAAVIGAAYGTLQLFAHGGLSPTAGNFRAAAYSLAAASLLAPPLVATVFAALARRGPASGAVWKALLLATLGNAIALGSGVLAAPQYWAILGIQLATIPTLTSIGLHWGPPPHASPAVAAVPPPPSSALRLAAAGCPDV
jgi:hypothetical protein